MDLEHTKPLDEEDASTGLKCQIVNVVATLNIGEKVDLEKASKIEGFSYDPEKYNGKNPQKVLEHV